MTTQRRFEQDLPALLTDLYVAGLPDYRDDLVQRIAATSQRPAWTFLERWLPMDFATQPVAAPRLPWRVIGVLAMIGLLLATALAFYVGSRPRLLDPFGVAVNGDIVYAADGDILVRDTLDAAPRALLSGPTDDHDPYFGPDGQRMYFVRTIDGKDYLMAAEADGSDVVQLMGTPLRTDAVSFSPDGSAVLTASEVRGIPRLFVVPTDGSGETQIETGGFIPLDASWRPPDGSQILVRGQRPDGTHALLLMELDGSPPVDLGLPAPEQFDGGSWDFTGAAWSPTGDRFAYNVPEVDPRDENISFRVHLLDVASARDTALPPPSDPSVQDGWALFSPDGKTILTHRWTWGTAGEGWLAVTPADGSGPARNIGPRITGGDRTGLVMTWSPAGDRVLMRTENTREVYSIDPVSGDYERLDWNAANLPDWQRRGE